MIPILFAARTGLGRGWTEFRHSLTRADEYMFTLLTSGVVLTVLYLLRDQAIPGMPVAFGAVALPGVVGGVVAFNTLTGAAFALSFEREDGTLLRAKAAPFGVVGYLTGQIVRIPLSTVVQVLILLVPGLFLFDGLTSTGAEGWFTFLWVLALGLLATLPLGLLLGGLANPRVVGQTVGLGSAALIAISGIFYPISALPGWLHPIAELFPFYWLGVGMRSALLPDAAAAVEITGTWRHLETAAVLGAWAVVGLVLAPVVLRRMARRVSGATVEAGRQQAAQRLG
jgi:ABC-2 type transport system permease protein